MIGTCATALDRPNVHETAGRPIGIADARIAAICRKLGATLATRNGSDFQGTGVEVVNLWEA